MYPWRCLVDGAGEGAYNMARDEALLERASAGEATLRVYTWRSPTVTVGKYQNVEATLNLEACIERGIPIIRRLTGGRGVLHGDDIGITVAAPIKALGFGAEPGPSISALYTRLIDPLRAGMEGAGILSPMDNAGAPRCTANESGSGADRFGRTAVKPRCTAGEAGTGADRFGRTAVKPGCTADDLGNDDRGNIGYAHADEPGESAENPAVRLLVGRSAGIASEGDCFARCTPADIAGPSGSKLLGGALCRRGRAVLLQCTIAGAANSTLPEARGGLCKELFKGPGGRYACPHRIVSPQLLASALSAELTRRLGAAFTMGVEEPLSAADLARITN